MRVTLQLGMSDKGFIKPSQGSVITNLERSQELTEEDRDLLHSYFIKYSTNSEWGRWLQKQYNVKVY